MVVTETPLQLKESLPVSTEAIAHSRRLNKIKRVAFISPNKIYCLTGGLDKTGATARPNVSVPALLVLGLLKERGYERLLIDAVAEAPTEFVELTPGVFSAGLSGEAVAEKLTSFAPNVILVTAMFSSEYFLVNGLAVELKKRFPGIPIIVGGIAATAHPKWFMGSGAVDVVVLGEAEHVLFDLLTELENARPNLQAIPNLLFRNGSQIVQTPRVFKLSESFPPYDYEIVLLLPDGRFRYDDRFTARTKTYRYKVLDGLTKSCVLFGSRGCPMGCDYCATTWRDGKAVRHMGAQRMFEDLRRLHREYGITVFYNQSDTFGVHPEDRKFLRLVAEYRRQHPEIVLNNPNAFFVRIFFKPDGSLDEELVQLLASAGFNVVTLAVETFVQRFNKKIDFKRISFGKIALLCDAIRGRQMKVDIYAIYCFPGQTAQEFYYDVQNFRELRKHVNDFSLCNLLYIPGTTYYDQATRDGWFTEEQYKSEVKRGYNFHQLSDLFNFSRIKTAQLLEAVQEFEVLVPFQ